MEEGVAYMMMGDGEGGVQQATQLVALQAEDGSQQLAVPVIDPNTGQETYMILDESSLEGEDGQLVIVGEGEAATLLQGEAASTLLQGESATLLQGESGTLLQGGATTLLEGTTSSELVQGEQGSVVRIGQEHELNLGGEQSMNIYQQNGQAVGIIQQSTGAGQQSGGLIQQSGGLIQQNGVLIQQGGGIIQQSGGIIQQSGGMQLVLQQSASSGSLMEEIPEEFQHKPSQNLETKPQVHGVQNQNITAPAEPTGGIIPVPESNVRVVGVQKENTIERFGAQVDRKPRKQKLDLIMNEEPALENITYGRAAPGFVGDPIQDSRICDKLMNKITKEYNLTTQEREKIRDKILIYGTEYGNKYLTKKALKKASKLGYRKEKQPNKKWIKCDKCDTRFPSNIEESKLVAHILNFHLDKVESESPIVVHKTNNQTTKTANINPSNQAVTAKINPTHQAVEQDVDDPSPAQELETYTGDTTIINQDNTTTVVRVTYENQPTVVRSSDNCDDTVATSLGEGEKSGARNLVEEETTVARSQEEEPPISRSPVKSYLDPEKADDIGPQLYRCDVCSQAFQTIKSLLDHQKYHCKGVQTNSANTTSTISILRNKNDTSIAEAANQDKDYDESIPENPDSPSKHKMEVIRKLADEWDDEDEGKETLNEQIPTQNTNKASEGRCESRSESLKSETLEDISREVAGIKADAASGKLSVTIQNDTEKHTTNAETRTGHTVNVVSGIKRKASQEDEDSIVADVDAILNNTDDLIKNVGKTSTNLASRKSPTKISPQRPSIKPATCDGPAAKKRPTAQCEECYEMFEDDEKLAWHALQDH